MVGCVHEQPSTDRKSFARVHLFAGRIQIAQWGTYEGPLQLHKLEFVKKPQFITAKAVAKLPQDR